MTDAILLVDDDSEHRETLACLLESEGFEVMQATNGRDALERLRKGPRPRAILLDMLMPVMNGWQFCEAQRADPELAAIPVVAISAAVKKDPRSPYFVDVTEIVSKPVVVDELLTKVRQVVRARK